jgi:hypothetical protein
VSFERLPDGIVGYATYELAELLAKLTTRQRDAIDRIVRHVYLNNRPWAELFRDQPPIDISDDHPLGRAAIPRICPEAMYYRRGTIDATTGERKGFGWGHDPDFKAALEQAVNLALGQQQRERLEYLQRAKRYAEQAAGPMVQVWVNVAAFSADDSARINAAAKVIDLAFKGAGESTDTGASLEQDWWAAAGGDK